jgi:choline monooxygenase
VHPELSRQVDARRYQVDVFDRWCRHSAPARDGSLTTGRWLWRFPGLGLNLYPDGMNVERFTPLGPTWTRVDYSFFFRDGDHDAGTVALSTEILAEDAAICEAVQRNLAAGAYRSGVLSPRHEGALVLLQRLVRERVEAFQRISAHGERDPR